MTFDPSIPLATDKLKQSQQDLLTNFTQLNAQFGIDHTAFEVAGSNGDGYHKQITFKTTTAPGAQVDPQSVLHTKTGTGGVYTNYSLPFFRNQSGDLPVLPDLKASGTDYGFQIGNMIINFGTGSILQGTSSLNVTWSIPFTTAAYIALASKNSTGIGLSGLSANLTSTGTLTTGTFSANTTLSSGNLPFFYLAIGY